MSAPPRPAPHPSSGPTRATTRVLAAAPDEVLVATAATRAGLLGEPARQVVVSGGDDLAAAVAEVGDDAVELVVGTSALGVGRTLVRRFGDAPVVLVAGGAAAYGPTPRALAGRLARRVEQVLHVDLVEGLRPLLLTERGTAVRAVPPESVRAVTAGLPAPRPVQDPTTLVLGRSGAWSGALDVDRETELLVAMVRRCAEAGHSRLLLLLDAEPSGRTRRHVERAAAASRAEVDVVVDAGPVDRWVALAGVRLVVGCASDDLLLARRVYGRRVAQLDTEVVVKHLSPFTDARRPGATLVAATVPDLRSWTAHPEGESLEPVDLAGLMGTVAYAMEPELLADRRAQAIGYLETHPGTRRRFVRRRRLTELRLPGGRRPVRAVLA